MTRALIKIGEIVTFRGKIVRLTDQEKRLLQILVESTGKVLKRAEIFDALYGDFDEIPEPKILDVLICKLRRKLGAIDERHGIETFPGTGYGYRVLSTEQVEKESDTMAKTFHHKLMRDLDGATYKGKQIPKHLHHAMRQALRKAQMRGTPLKSERELAQATFTELARGNG